jgi:8-oxo-dGTP diphosphatase
MPTGPRGVTPRKRTAATVLITDPRGRVLVVEPTYKPRWELPGGAVEDGESPRRAAVREVAEELRLDRAPGRILALDYVPAGSGSTRTEGLVVVFDGGVLTDVDVDELRLPPDELSAWAFVEPPELGSYLPPLQTRRVAAALHARTTGHSAYLEDGRPT